ncbi:MAG: methyltransferase domain-containing protein [Armatimonadota bacterium]
MAEAEYVLGTHDEERDRLGLQHRLWSGPAFALWERAGIAPGQRVLDLGCGPGFTTFDLAGVVGPTGRVFGVDVSERFVGYLRERARRLELTHVDAAVGDVQQLELAEASFDAAYQRWVLCFVPDPEAVIAAAARALRPGGVFAIQEYLHYRGILLAPGSAAFRRVVEVVDGSWRARGGDPDVGRRLPELLLRRGFAVEEVRHLVRTARPEAPLWQWPATFFRTNLPLLVASGQLTAEKAEAFHTDWQAHTENPGAFFCSPPMVEIIARKR